MIPEFRAWDKCKKIMITEYHIPYYDDVYGVLLNDVFNDSRVIFEQYTGLKDVNGNKIFEGDIVKTDQHGYNQPDSYVVKEFIQNVCIFRSAQVTDGSTMFEEATNGHDLTVVGNIHENAELLEVDE